MLGINVPKISTNSNSQLHLSLPLKNPLLLPFHKLLDGMLEGASEIREPLKVMSNVLISDPEQARQVCQEVGLPHFLFDLIEDVLGTTVVLQVKQPTRDHISLAASKLY